MSTSNVRSTRRLVPVILAMFLAACGGGRTSSPSAPAATEPAPRPSEPSMKDQIDELEQQGVLPELDRSTDIAGPDADGNGIRDDIDAYIAALPVSEPVKRAARQVARVQQKSLLLDLKDKPVLMALSDASMESTACMSSTILNGVSPELESRMLREGHAIIFKIEAITANTPERAERYLAYMGALHGTTTTYPTGKVCEDG